MKKVNDSIKNALMKPTTQRKGRIYVNEQYYDVYNANYYADGYDEGQVIGNAISTQLDFDLPYMPKFDKFKYYDGIFTDFGYEYVDMGTFTVFDEKDNDEFTKHITAFDNLINFNTPFVPKDDYPKTLFEELQNVCEQAKTELENTSITNGDFIIENNQFVNGESLKTVLKGILMSSGDIGVIKNDKLKLLLEEKTDFSMDKSQHEPMTWKRRSYGINQLIIGDSQVEGEYVIRQDDEDIAKNGVHKLVIYDNPFAYTEDKRDALIDNLFNKVKGFGYLPYELKGEWFNFLEIGDVITIDGNETRVFRINGKSPNALDSEMSAPAIIDSSLEFLDNTNDVKNQMKVTERKVDKQNQVIEDTIIQVNEQEEKITQAVQTVDGFKQTVEDMQQVIDEGGFVDEERLQSAITQSASQIESNVSKTYSTKTETTQAKNDAISSANTNTTNKLKDYSTTTQMQSAIKQSADSISQSVSQQITDAEGNILDNVNGQLDLYIKKKDTGEVVSAFNLNSNEVVINSDNFKLDAQGNTTMNSAHITGGKIEINDKSATSGNWKDAYIILEDERYKNDPAFEYSTKINSSGIRMRNYASTAADIVTDIDNYGMRTSTGNLRTQVNPGAVIVNNVLEYEQGDYNQTNIFSDSISTKAVYIYNTPTESNHAIRMKDIALGGDGYCVSRGGDLNELTTTGFYYMYSTVNSPNGNGYVLVIKFTDVYILQAFVPFNQFMIYLRQMVDGSWTEWKRVASA